MENMENPKKLAVATIAGLTEVAGMAAPAMADETAADPTVGQTQSADPTKDALDKANTAVSESQTAYDNAQQNVQDAQSKVDDAYASDPATNAAQSELDAAQSAKKDADQSAADAQADVDDAQAALAEVNATLKTAETALATAKSDAESAQDAYDKAHKVVTPSKDTTITVDQCEQGGREDLHAGQAWRHGRGRDGDRRVYHYGRRYRRSHAHAEASW